MGATGGHRILNTTDASRLYSGPRIFYIAFAAIAFFFALQYCNRIVRPAAEGGVFALHFNVAKFEPLFGVQFRQQTSTRATPSTI
jgi:hypothetical protein